MDLHLDDEQASELHKLLTDALGELSSEIADTDNPSFQRALRARRRHLQEIEEQLSQHHATRSDATAPPG
jgi:Na+/phosphate symporter